MRLLLSVTLSGSALAVLLLLLRYVVFRKMPSTVYYYAWLLVLLRFALPLPGLVPVGTSESAVPAAAAYVPAPAAYDGPSTVRPMAAGVADLGSEALPVSTPQAQTMQPAAANEKHYVNFKSPQFWLGVWGAGAAVSLAFYVLSYELFSVRIRRSLSLPTHEDRRVYKLLPGKKPRLRRCAACDTPLMFGVFRPLITLPERVYSEELLTNILRHELLHYRRRDPLYKWLAVAVLSTQWFNPLSYLIRRELNRACELSCDEMLLKYMDRADKQSYGNTLLSMAASGALPAGVVATTFSTEKRNLKERLEQIMHYQRNGKRLLAAVLALVLLLGGAVLAGPLPGAAAEDQPEHVVKVSTVDELLAAIAPDTVIELEAGTYDLTTASDYGQDTHSAYYSWNGAYDGFELVLQNMRNLTIRGAGQGETVLAAVPRYANVLQFYGCQGINVEALTAGHTTEPGFCMGGVLSFDNCERVTVGIAHDVVVRDDREDADLGAGDEARLTAGHTGDADAFAFHGLEGEGEGFKAFAEIVLEEAGRVFGIAADAVENRPGVALQDLDALRAHFKPAAVPEGVAFGELKRLDGVGLAEGVADEVFAGFGTGAVGVVLFFVRAFEHAVVDDVDVLRSAALRFRNRNDRGEFLLDEHVRRAYGYGKRSRHEKDKTECE